MINHESVFWFFALAGTGLLAIQIIISLVGINHDTHDHGAVEEGQFKWMSKQAFAGFLMMYGWVGLTCSLQFSFSLFVSILLATVAGFVASFLASLIFHLAKKAHSPGTVFKIEEAVGKEAVVYHRIPKKGTGTITVSLQNFTHEINAYCEEEIPSFTIVQIIKKLDDKTVVVTPIGPL